MRVPALIRLVLLSAVVGLGGPGCVRAASPPYASRAVDGSGTAEQRPGGQDTGGDFPAAKEQGADFPAAADTGADSDSTQSCGSHQVVGAYAIWCGKVNVHLDNNKWVTDSSCNSGCEMAGLSYCQKFYPKATLQVEVPPSAINKPFYTVGCKVVYPSPGHRQFLCCAP